MADVRVDPAKFDLAEDNAWEAIIADIERGVYDGGLLSPPCSTFTPARANHLAHEQGPSMLRGFGLPHIYGLPGLKGKDKDKVRLGTLLAVRAAQAARAFHVLGLPWVFETPA
eukprot:1471343-Heterocapsa_arctica.AAC.1